MNPRIRKACVKLKKERLDALLLTSQPNISYLTNYTSRDSYLLLSEKENVFFTDARYTTEAKKSLQGIKIEKINGSIFNLFLEVCGKLKLRRVGFEEKNLTFSGYQRLKEALTKNNKDIELIPIGAVVEELREIKNQDEIEKIKKAASITIRAMEFIKGLIRPGKKELEIAAEIERFIRCNGARTSAFEIIVASGPNSSSPHHITGDRSIKNDEPVLIDMGVDYAGYKSDLTRVFFLGKISPLTQKVYAIILNAQAKAITQIRPGVSVKKLDRVAREYIAKGGYNSFFGHSLGHGVGLEAHESPRISDKENKELKAGMVITIEPGIYLPNKFGIRIEDMILVTRKGYEVLSGALYK